MAPNAIGGFMAETCNAIETPTGATVRLRRQGRRSDLEYFVDVERNDETVTLCKADPHDVARYWANLTAEIDDHGTGQQAKTDPWAFDEYGPTKWKPLPAGEAARQNWRIQLRKRGFSPNTLIEEDTQRQGEYHRDDARKPEIWERERQELGEIESDPSFSEFEFDQGDEVRVDWSEGMGPEDEITGIVEDVARTGGEIVVGVRDPDNDEFANGKNYDAAPEWIQPIEGSEFKESDDGPASERPETEEPRAVADGGLDPMVERFLKNAERVKGD
jgi:hypothetical protein